MTTLLIFVLLLNPKGGAHSSSTTLQFKSYEDCVNAARGASMAEIVTVRAPGGYDNVAGWVLLGYQAACVLCCRFGGACVWPLVRLLR
jgi:hypothetical protein